MSFEKSGRSWLTLNTQPPEKKLAKREMAARKSTTGPIRPIMACSQPIRRRQWRDAGQSKPGGAVSRKVGAQPAGGGHDGDDHGGGHRRFGKILAALDISLFCRLAQPPLCGGVAFFFAAAFSDESFRK